jgi:hypothetical protein
MKNINFDYYSSYYLNQWIVHERNLHSLLQTSDRNELLDGLTKAVKYFVVARNLPRAYDVAQGIKRYEPLVNEFFKVNRYYPSEHTCIKTVDRFARSIGGRYGGTNLISLASKLLWLRFQDPFIIYDSNVRTALGVNPGNYADYASKWIRAFDNSKEDIALAVLRLSDVSLASLRPSLDMSQVDLNLVKNSWFHQRVFDMYLWHKGRAAP